MVTFPESFLETDHHMAVTGQKMLDALDLSDEIKQSVFKSWIGLKHWAYPKEGMPQITVIGGPNWNDADGINTFEVMDHSLDYSPHVFTKEQLNVYLATKYGKE